MDAAGGWLYAGDYGQGVFRSSDRGKTWKPVNAGLPEPWWIFSLAIDPERPKTLLATNSVGIYRSLDRGKSWQHTGGPLISNPFAVVFQRRGRALAVGHDEILRSTDAGATWQRTPVPVVSEFYFTSLAAGPTTVYAGGVGPLEEGGDIFRSLRPRFLYLNRQSGGRRSAAKPSRAVPSILAQAGGVRSYRVQWPCAQRALTY